MNDPDAIIRTAILTHTGKLQTFLKRIANEFGALSRIGREADEMLNLSMEGRLIQRLNSLSASQRAILYRACARTLEIDETQAIELWERHKGQRQSKRMS